MKNAAWFVILVFVIHCIIPADCAGQTLSLSGGINPSGRDMTFGEVFRPSQLKGMIIDRDDPFRFEFMIDRGDALLTDEQKQREYSRLIKYFLASLAVPDKDQWVNLSPYEQDRIIPENFGLTEMGRDLLAQDYLLKQMSAALTNPDTELGKKFWDRVYARAYQQFGTTDIPTDTFNKVWIVPDRAVVYEKGQAVYVLEHHLKVMMEKDYLASRQAEPGVTSPKESEVSSLSKEAMREIIIPAIEKEVNEGSSFAPLRQVYSSMLLACWYKGALKEAVLNRLYADKGRVKGIDQEPGNNETIYAQYLEGFRRGAFDMIREDADQNARELVPRRYFSGGTLPQDFSRIVRMTETSGSQAVDNAEKNLDAVSVQFRPASPLPLRQQVEILLQKVERGRVPSILFVCTGNVNRSAFMEMIARNSFGKDRIEVDIRSAGTILWQRGVVREQLKKFLDGVVGAGWLKIWRHSNLEKLLKALSGDSEDFERVLMTTGHLPANLALTLDDVVTAFRYFNKQDLVRRLESYGLGLDWLYGPEVDKLANWFNMFEQRLIREEVLKKNRDILKVARENGISESIVRSYYPKVITPTLVRTADLIVVADRSHVSFIQQSFPQAADKIFLLKAFDPQVLSGSYDLKDPYAGTISEEASFREISDLIEKQLLPMFRGAEDPAESVSADNAMKGGIDLDPAGLDMQIQRGGQDAGPVVASSGFENIRIDGLIPEILEIRPAVPLDVLR